MSGKIITRVRERERAMWRNRIAEMQREIDERREAIRAVNAATAEAHARLLNAWALLCSVVFGRSKT